MKHLHLIENQVNKIITGVLILYILLYSYTKKGRSKAAFLKYMLRFDFTSFPAFRRPWEA